MDIKERVPKPAPVDRSPTSDDATCVFSVQRGCFSRSRSFGEDNRRIPRGSHSLSQSLSLSSFFPFVRCGHGGREQPAQPEDGEDHAVLHQRHPERQDRGEGRRGGRPGVRVGHVEEPQGVRRSASFGVVAVVGGVGGGPATLPRRRTAPVAAGLRRPPIGGRGAVPAVGAQEEEVAGRLHACAGLRARAALRAAEVPQRPGEGGPGGRPQAHRDAGQDLVSEPQVQDQTETDAAAGVEPARPERETGRRQGPRQGRHPDIPPAEVPRVPEGLRLLPRRAPAAAAAPAATVKVLPPSPPPPPAGLLRLRPARQGRPEVPEDDPGVDAEPVPAVLELDAAVPLFQLLSPVADRERRRSSGRRRDARQGTGAELVAIRVVTWYPTSVAVWYKSLGSFLST